MSIVAIDAVSKHYGSVAALDDVSLTIEDGEFFALLGPSGSGKTTLLRAIAGFVKPQAGAITVDGEDIRDQPVHRRDIGMVFQHYALFPHMSVFDNVAFGLTVRRIGADEVSRRVHDILALVELAGFESRMPAQLSGGQQQRVALARALITRPRVLLLDEPLGALDKRLRQQMQIELREIQREVGITTVFVTHDQEEALTLSDRIALLDQGRIVQVGSPASVYERPRTRFAAGFLGDANFFTGVAQDVRDDVLRISMGDEFLYTTEVASTSGASVTLAVRPEKLQLNVTGGVGDAVNRLPGMIQQVVYAGNSMTYKVACADQVVTVFEQNSGPRTMSQGDEVTLSWSPAHSIVVVD